MTNKLKWLARYIGFWLVCFAVFRTTFLLFHFDGKSSVIEVLLGNIHALPLDISTACYAAALLLIIRFIIGFTSAKNSFNKIAQGYTALLLGIVALLNLIDINLYHVWQSKLNRLALSYAKYPDEIVASSGNGYSIGAIVLIICIYTALLYMYKKLFINHAIIVDKYSGYIVAFLISVTFVIVGIRGGLQKLPIDKSWAYYSNNNSLNNTSLNSAWNAIQLITVTDLDTNTYRYMPQAISDSVYSALHNDVGNTNEFKNIINAPKPNVLLLFWESCGADIIAPLGGEKNVAPKFTELCKEGILFTNFYSTGFRTDQGLVATLSGFPAQPLTRIIEEHSKFDKLPNLITSFKNNGYSANYYYGGRSTFANTSTYLKSAGIDKIVDEKQFEGLKRTLWGVYDSYLFDYLLKNMSTDKQPFFNIVATITSHEDFDADVTKHFTKGSESENGYRNTMHYTDSCIYNFIQRAKKTTWYANTIIVIVADHGHSLPLNRGFDEVALHHIPCLIIGGALSKNDKGKTNDNYGSHVALASTLLHQLKIDSKDYVYSKNLMNNTQTHFAYYAYDDGFGYVSAQEQSVFSHLQNKLIHTTHPQDSSTTLLRNKALLQKIMYDYTQLSAKIK